MWKSKPASDAVSAAVVLTVALLGGSAAFAQSAAPVMQDPQRVVVIVDDAGDVGLRISDAQMINELLVNSLRKRLGDDAVVYEGARKSAESMKRMLGKNAETGIQDGQLAFFDAVDKHAPARARVRFALEDGRHVVTASCRKNDHNQAPAAAVVDDKRASGKTFVEARDALAALLPGFCLTLLPAPAAVEAIPIEGAPLPGIKPKQKSQKPWVAPPRRD